MTTNGRILIEGGKLLLNSGKLSNHEDCCCCDPCSFDNSDQYDATVTEHCFTDTDVDYGPYYCSAVYPHVGENYCRLNWSNQGYHPYGGNVWFLDIYYYHTGALTGRYFAKLFTNFPPNTYQYGGTLEEITDDIACADGKLTGTFTLSGRNTGGEPGGHDLSLCSVTVTIGP